MQVVPNGLAPQLVQAPPSLPQAMAPVPAAHCPARQQPPLHSALASHLRPQAWVTGSHAWPAGQSTCELQPQLAPPPPTVTQAAPRTLLPQSSHCALPVAQAAPALPRAQVPPAQQPPLQRALASQAAPHTEARHARPAGHSADEVQPQVPAGRRHLGPVPTVPQSWHRPPSGSAATVAHFLAAIVGAAAIPRAAHAPRRRACRRRSHPSTRRRCRWVCRPSRRCSSCRRRRTSLPRGRRRRFRDHSSRRDRGCHCCSRWSGRCRALTQARPASQSAAVMQPHFLLGGSGGRGC